MVILYRKYGTVFAHAKISQIYKNHETVNIEILSSIAIQYRTSITKMLFSKLQNSQISKKLQPQNNLARYTVIHGIWNGMEWNNKI